MYIVTAADEDVAGWHQELAVEDEFVAAEGGAGLYVAAAAEPPRRGSGTGGVGYAHGIIGIENGGIAATLGFEEAALGGGVVVEGMVAVQVVLRDVERESDVRAKFEDGLQLEAGEFEHVPAVVARRADHGCDREPDVAAHLNGDAGLAEDMADQAGGGGLAVGAGDADGAALEEARGELDLADDGYAAAARS